MVGKENYGLGMCHQAQIHKLFVVWFCMEFHYRDNLLFTG